jgi:pSer/pThr/pTyr-binding forkhead associated (FHA) protein
MTKLVLSVDGVVIKEVALTKERMTLGRKPYNDIVIDHLAVSGEHAVVVTLFSDSFLEDLGSTNGTFVNGQPVKKHFLQNGDIIELGKYRLKFVTDVMAVTSASLGFNLVAKPVKQSVEASFISPSTEPQTATAFDELPTLAQTAAFPPLASAAADTPPPALIRLLDGPNAGRELPLTKALTTLGRPGVQVAVITRRPQGYFITHVQGVQFPVVNGYTLGAEAYPLTHGDLLELSGMKMEFFLQS